MGQKKVVAWSNAMSIIEHKPAQYAKNITLRYEITAPFDADALWLTFDNFCGLEPVSISEVTVAIMDNESIDENSVSFARVKGIYSFDMSPGQKIVSDEIKLKVTKGQKLAVSYYLEDFTNMQSAVYVSGPLSKSWFAVGNYTQTNMPMEFTKENSWVYFLSEVDFLTDDSNHSLVCFGDSITAQNWPDELALLAYANPDNHTAVVRRAASGCRVLRQYSCLKYDSYGLKADIRIPHEFPMPGANRVIVQEGINDIIHPVGVENNPFRPWEDMPTFEELKNGLQYIVDELHKHKMEVYLGTLLPIEGWRTYADFRDELRNRINDWMRSGSEAEGCIDFDLAVRDTVNIRRFKENFDSGDHLHPSKAGYKAMAEAVPQKLYKN